MSPRDSSLQNFDLFRVENSFWILNQHTGQGIYDFAFDRFFACHRPYTRPERVTAIARVGAFDYELFSDLKEQGIELIHSPEEHSRASLLPNWYPLLKDLTPKSRVFDKPPSAETIEQIFGRHKRKLSVINSPFEYHNALKDYERDPILHWQQIVCREYVPLRIVEDSLPERIPTSFEFRIFFWKGQVVGFGRYWWNDKFYKASPQEQGQAIAIATEAAKRLEITFLVVDVAQKIDGSWIVIECNDGQ